MEIDGIDVDVFEIPTDAREESDGTAVWNKTTAVVVRASAQGATGIGYTYGGAAAGTLARDLLVEIARGADPLSPEAAWQKMLRAVRNHGLPGICAMAISAVDCALWDLKARILKVPLCKLLGQVRESVPLYGSGGFTSYAIDELTHQLGGWADRGFRRVKMKVGRDPARDLERVRAARGAIGSRVELFVDANGAYSRKQALRFADEYAGSYVRWFEEPVSSDDLEGLRLLRDRAPMEIAAGEYGYTPWYFRQMLGAGAVDVLQADATRCLGVTGFLRAAALCEAFQVPLSAHCAPALHAHLGCAAQPLIHLEYFHDHERVERLLFEGTLEPVDGELRPDPARPGNGLSLRAKDAERWRIK